MEVGWIGEGCWGVAPTTTSPKVRDKKVAASTKDAKKFQNFSGFFSLVEGGSPKKDREGERA